MVKCPGKAGSNDLVWQLIRGSNAFTVTGRGGERKMFSKVRQASTAR